MNPKFGNALRKAALEGIEIYAYSSQFIGNEIKLKKKIDLFIKIIK